MTSEILSPELDYRTSTLRHGSKVFTQIYQQTGGSTVTVQVQSTTDSIFEIPIRAFSLPDSFIRGTITPTAGGAGNYNWFYENVHLANEIHLYTRGGQYLAQVFNLPNYDALTTPCQTAFDDFIGNDPTDRFYPNRNAGTTTDIGGRIVGSIPAIAPYTESTYAQVGTANAATPVFPFTLRLSRIRDTIFSLRKTLMMTDVILLRVVWGPLQKFSTMSAAATVIATTSAVPAGTVVISNMALFLAVETDPAIIADVSALARGGYQLPIPFVYCNKQTTLAATSQAITVKATPDMGYMLKKLIYAPFNNTDAETKTTALDHDNRAGAKIVSYQTQLDSVQRQQYLVNCASPYDDWNLHRRMCKGSAIQGRDMYQYNWFHCEDFSGMTIEDNKSIPGDVTSVMSGIPIVGPQGSERIWTLSATSVSTAFNHYTFLVTYKTLMVSPGGIEVRNMPPS